MSSSTVALQLLDGLREYGVDTIFGIPGGAVAPLYNALLERPEIRVVTTKHESGAMFLAMGYAMSTGRPGVVVTTAGPGITNALTGLASAFYDGVPVLHIAGEVSRSSFGRGALQEGSAHGLDAVSMVRRFTKFSAEINRPGSAPAVLRKALATAYSGRRGPAFISIPLDVAGAPASPQPIAGSVRSSFDIDGPSCRQAMDWLERARRPLIVAGSGARDFTSRRALRRLAEHLGAPVAVTTKAKGIFPEDHPLYLGLLGFAGHETVTRYLAEGVDTLLVCGSGLGDITTNGWTPLLKPSQAFIQVDIDAGALGKNYPVDLGLLGPVDGVLGRMLEHRGEGHVRPKLALHGPSHQPAEPSATGKLTTAEAVQILSEVCPPNSVFTADIGEHLGPALHYLRVREEGDFVACIGFSSMGSGLCSAIGYQMGAPGRRSYAICGDGGFLMYGAELATAVQYHVPTTFVIMNDSRLNMVHHGLKELYGHTVDLSTQEVDFAAAARAVGATGAVVRTAAELRTALGQPAPAGPVVLDVRIDPEARLRGNQRVAALQQFKEPSHG